MCVPFEWKKLTIFGERGLIDGKGRGKNYQIILKWEGEGNILIIRGDGDKGKGFVGKEQEFSQIN